MNGLCNLNNVIYQAIISPKENITDKKNLYRVDFHEMEGEVFKPQIYLFPRTPKTPHGTIETILVFEKQRVNPWDWMVYFEKNQILQTVLTVDAICA